MGRVAAGAAPHFAEAAALVHRRLERAVQRVANQMQSLEKVALARAVDADKKSQRTQPQSQVPMLL